MEQKKVTLKEIAEKTGVSMATVHRAIYGKGGLSEETRKKIMDEVERSNYQLDESGFGAEAQCQDRVCGAAKSPG